MRMRRRRNNFGITNSGRAVTCGVNDSFGASAPASGRQRRSVALSSEITLTLTTGANFNTFQPYRQEH
ncbi:hypothetical protein ABVT39_004821 [Epinephelus coioides]